MFDVKDKRLLPYKGLLFGALGLYLWKLNKVNKEGGDTKVTLDTEKLSQAAMPFLPVKPEMAGQVQAGMKEALDKLFERVKK